MKSKTLRSLATKINPFRGRREETQLPRKEPALRLAVAGGTPPETFPIGHITYDGYPECYKGFIAPLKKQHPNWERLDGSTIKKGNPRPVTWFKHAGGVWRIHADASFEVLSRVNDGWGKWGKAAFQEKQTTTTSKALKPRPELGSPKYCYIYLDSKKATR